VRERVLLKEKNVRGQSLLCCALVLLCACSSREESAQTASTVLYEGARLITGDGGEAIEDAAFLVENDRFVSVGRKGELQAPAGAARVDLAGKTVIPALIDLHSHPGYTIIKTNETRKDTYTRENLLDHLRRYAYYGVSATLSMGTDLGNTAYEVRSDTRTDAARLFTAGSGIALPGAGPGAEYRKDSAYGVTSEDEARKAVQQLAAKKVELVKIWVDDRNGTVKKLPPDLYRAIIDEAHKNNLRVAAHIYYLADAKELLRSGIDGFAHGVRDRDIDDEFMALLRERDIFLIPNLPERPLTEEDLALTAETLPAEQVNRIREQIAKRDPVAVQRQNELFAIQARNLKRISDAGAARIGLGTDSGVSIGWTAHAELADMVAAGMTPGQTIVAATKTAAEILRLGEQGTVASGKRADFIVLDANPLENIANTRRIANVYLRGKEIDRAALKASFTSSAKGSS
jgi:imidazolonepropionase-like amidohydrolase